MPQFDYTLQAASDGMIATANPVEIESYTNPLLAQISDIAIGAAPAGGTYTIQIEGPEGTYQFSYTSPGGETQAQIVAGLLAALNSDPDLLGFVSGVDASPSLELHFLATGQTYTVTAAANPGGIASITITQAAGGTDLPLGVAVVPGANAGEVALPTAGSVAADVLGVTTPSLDAEITTGQVGPQVFEPGSTVSVLEHGEIYVWTEGAVAFNDPVHVRINNAAGKTTGTFRNTADGADTVQLANARFRSTLSAAGLAVVKINRP